MIEPNFKQTREQSKELLLDYAKNHPYCEWHKFYDKSQLPGNDVHHIIYKSHQGSDLPENLIVLCRECHLAIHSGNIKRYELNMIKETNEDG